MCVVDEDHQLLMEKLVLRERCFECVFYLNLNKVHHSVKITMSPLNDICCFFLVAGVIWTYLLSPAQKMTRKGPVYLAYLFLQGMVMNRNSADGKTTWYFSVSLMQTFHYGQLILLLAHTFWNVCELWRTTYGILLLNYMFCPWSHWRFTSTSQNCKIQEFS